MSTRRALLFSFLDRYAGLALSILSSIVIARLLTPAELGVFSVTMILILFVSTMRDLGAGQFMVQVKELTPEGIRSTWAVMLGMGCAMALVVLAMAYPMSWLYQEPRIVAIMAVIAINFVVSPFGSMTYAWLMREMKFESLAIMRLGSSVAGAITSVALAYGGQGPISLAYGQLVATLVNAVMAVHFRPAHFGWAPGFKDIRQVVGFGGKITLSTIVNSLASGAAELFLGKLQGLAAAGYYSRANGLATMFQRLVLDATQAVAIPLFAKARREQGNFEEPFLKATAYVTALGWTFHLWLAMLAFPVTRLLYGTQWDASVDATRWLALGMAIAVPCAMCTQALMAAGKATQLLYLSTLGAALQIVAAAGGAMLSLEWAAIGYAAAQAAMTPVWLLTTRRAAAYSWARASHSLLLSAALALLTCSPVMVTLFRSGLRSEEDGVSIFFSLLLGCIIFPLAALLLRHPLGDEIRALSRRLRAHP
jgi:O-antigen/teichoic acid export membrane protein